MPLVIARPEFQAGAVLRVAGLFAGVGGIELGLERAGHSTCLVCENDPAASAVLKQRFPKATHRQDIRRLMKLPPVDLVTAGFPCQDLSQAGRVLGIGGTKSGLVSHLLRLLRTNSDPDWVLLENVPFMLQLDKGQAMSWLTERFEELGYTWAYRTVDTRSFGLPHRRRRVLFLASRRLNPPDILFADDSPASNGHPSKPTAFGFYWTEGNTGLGWGRDCVPTLKGGSGLGIPSPPAIWIPEIDQIGVPHICDGERLQGLPRNWTKVSLGSMSLGVGARWRLVGNAVSVPVAEWLGRRFSQPGCADPSRLHLLSKGDRWPMAASGGGGARWSVDIGEFPVSVIPTPLRDFLKEELEPLSLRAAKGFLDRFEVSSLKKDKRFVAALRRFVRRAQKLVPPSSGTRHKMKSVAQSETNLELKLINALRSTRLKFEQNAPAVPGLRTRPDIVFRNKKVAVYVDGCFWHACPHHGTRPRSNSEFWDEKLRRNADRDQENTRALQERGWTVIRFWGHQGAVEMVETLKRTLKAG
jgi:DNA (cytosine-5)-methyltransferase 1